MFQHLELFDVLLKVAKEDNGAARVSSLNAIQNIASCADNHLDMSNNSDLLSLLANLVNNGS